MKLNRPAIDVSMLNVTDSISSHSFSFHHISVAIGSYSLPGTSTGRKCDGYEEPKLLAYRPKVTSPLGDVTEMRSLQFFTEMTVKQLGSFFSDELWTKRVIQLAYSNDGIKHALLALSSHHERFLQVGYDGATSFATKHQSLAIKQVLANTSNQCTLVHLLSCLMFICIEVSLMSCH